MKTMTFAQFQASREWCDDLTDCPYYWADKADGPCPGYAYDEGSAFIDRLPSGEYQLVIYDMDEVSDDLAELEAKLYRYGVDESWFSEGARLDAPDTPERLAKRFSYVLRGWLSSDEIAEVIERNKTAKPNVCHSHDFCDANMVMADAWRQVIGGEIDADDEAQATLWGTAWELANKEGFTP